MSGKQTVAVPVQFGMSRPGLTLEDYCALGYRHSLHGGVDPAADAAATLDHAEVVDEIARLDPFIQRDAVSRRRQVFLRRVADQIQAVNNAVVDAKPVSA